LHALRALSSPAARLWLSLLCYTVSTSMSAPLIGLQAYRVGASPGEIGAIYGVAALTTFLSRLPMAALEPRLGSGVLIKLGVLANSASLTAYALAPSVSFMYLAGLLRGLGLASFHPSALSEAVRVSGGSSSLGWVMTSPPLGMSLGPVISSAVLIILSQTTDERMGHSAAFLMGAIFSGLALMAPGGGSGYRVRGGFSALLNREMALLVSSRFLVSYAAGAVNAILPVLLVERRLAAEAHVPLIFAWSSVFNVLGRPLSTRVGGLASLTLSSALMAAAGVLLLPQRFPLVLAGMALHGLSLGLFIPSSILVIQGIGASYSLTFRIAVLTLAIDLGSGIGSASSGAFSEVVEPGAVLAVSVLFAGAGTLPLTRLLSERFSPR